MPRRRFAITQGLFQLLGQRLGLLRHGPGLVFLALCLELLGLFLHLVQAGLRLIQRQRFGAMRISQRHSTCTKYHHGRHTSSHRDTSLGKGKWKHESAIRLPQLMLGLPYTYAGRTKAQHTSAATEKQWAKQTEPYTLQFAE